MATYQISAPDGSAWEVNAPDSASQDDVMKYAQDQWKQRQQPQANDAQVPGLSGGLDVGAQLARQLGLTVRAGVQGIAAIPAMPGDALGLKSSEALNNVLDYWLPKPQGDVENFSNKVAAGMAGQGGFIKAAGALAPRVTALTTGPGMQIASAGSAAGGSEAARQSGAGTTGELASGLAAGLGLPTAAAFAATGARAASRIPMSLIAPFTQGGRLDSAARLYQNAATSPTEAAYNIRNAQQFVPGVSPTTAEVANDAGISGLYKTLRNNNTGPFANIEAANDAARQAYLGDQFGNAASIRAAQAARDTATAATRNSALTQANAGGVQSAPIIASIDTTLSTPGLRASDVVKNTLNDVRAKIASLTDSGGVIDAKDLYTIRKELGTTIQKHAQASQNWDKRLTSGLEQQLQREMDSAIVNAGGTSWPQYLQQYANASRGINAMKTGQDITAASLNNSTERLSPAKYANQVANNAEDVAAMGARGSDVVTRMNQDLKRSISPMNATKVAGSDTAQNLSGAQALESVLGQVPGGRVTQLTARVLNSLYAPQDAKVKQMVLNGMLSPAVGEILLATPLRARPDLMGGLLAQRTPIFYGGLLGAATAQ